jgi:endonuclease/exonuclease/phosphatase (EEP) superfamily protein YafD
MLQFILISMFAMSENLLMEFGQAPAPTTSQQREFTLVTWNIYKGQKEGLYQDLQQIVKKSDFVLMQEFSLNNSQERLMQSLGGTHWALAKSFEGSDGWTGVATMSKWQPEASIPVRSPGSEPFVGTPKMTLISKYRIAGKDFWIVNLHGLNFDITHVDFEEQIDDVVSRLANYHGALIFAGDFNTWSTSRHEYLLAKTNRLGLNRLDIENPMGLFSATLDHIFYRGVQVLEYRAMHEFQSSDHLPLKIRYAVPFS